MHTARIWMASATPGGAPGYDYDKEFGDNVAHSRSRTSQRLRGYTARSPEVKGRTPFVRFWQCNRVPAIRRVGILRFQPPDWLPVIASEAKQSIVPQAQAEEWIASSLRSSQ